MIILSPTVKSTPEVQAGCWSGLKRSIRINKKSPQRSKLPPGGLTVDQGSVQPQLVCTPPRCTVEHPDFRQTRSPNTPTPLHATSAGMEITIVPKIGGLRTSRPRTRPRVQIRSSARK